jgi:hypothetical protein
VAALSRTSVPHPPFSLQITDSDWNVQFCASSLGCTRGLSPARGVAYVRLPGRGMTSLPSSSGHGRRGIARRRRGGRTAMWTPLLPSEQQRL